MDDLDLARDDAEGAEAKRLQAYISRLAKNVAMDFESCMDERRQISSDHVCSLYAVLCQMEQRKMIDSDDMSTIKINYTSYLAVQGLL